MVVPAKVAMNEVKLISNPVMNDSSDTFNEKLTELFKHSVLAIFICVTNKCLSSLTLLLSVLSGNLTFQNTVQYWYLRRYVCILKKKNS